MNKFLHVSASLCCAATIVLMAGCASAPEGNPADGAPVVASQKCANTEAVTGSSVVRHDCDNHSSTQATSGEDYMRDRKASAADSRR